MIAWTFVFVWGGGGVCVCVWDIKNIYIPLILKGHSGQYLGLKGLGPFENPLKCPSKCFFHEKINLPHFQTQWYMHSYYALLT